jgi:hypothetical protein
MTERTYFGLLISGVYSNADLYANYAGMKFYRGLTDPIAIGERRIRGRCSQGWQVADRRRVFTHNLLKPFITDHLNEALNPGYAFNLIGSVRRIVKNTTALNGSILTPTSPLPLSPTSQSALESWTCEDYGYTKRDRTVHRRDLLCKSDSNGCG